MSQQTPLEPNAGLLAVVVMLALSGCMPGSGEDKPEAAKPEQPAEPVPKPVEPPRKSPTPAPESKTLHVRIDVRGCSIADAPPVDCKSLCERAEPFTGIEDAVVSATDSPHETVVAVLDCLKSKNISKVAIHSEPKP